MRLFQVTAKLLRSSNIGKKSETLPDSLTFENYMSSAYISESYKFSTVKLESFEALAGSLKMLSPGHCENSNHNIKELIHLLGPFKLKICNKIFEQESIPAKSLISRQWTGKS